MNVDIEKMLQDIKEPTLYFKFASVENSSPNLNSYVGGTPYSEKSDRTPTCRKCKNPMEFVFQLNIPKDTEDGFLMYVFYYCFECTSTSGNKGFKIIKYDNPSEEKNAYKNNLKSKIKYAEFDFDIQWSLPDWDSLGILKPTISKSFLKEYKADAPVIYENTKEKILNDWSFNEFSFYGGYPNFLGFPNFPKCEGCDELMVPWFQIDSTEELGLVWKDYGCLHVFKCKNGNDNFKILIQ